MNTVTLSIEDDLIKIVKSDVSTQPPQTSNIPTSNGLLWVAGKKYFIRTVTHHLTGVFVGFTSGEKEVVLESAAWIADDGRLTDALRSGDFKEVEMFPIGPVGVGRESIIDIVQISEIPTSQK